MSFSFLKPQKNFTMKSGLKWGKIMENEKSLQGDPLSILLLFYESENYRSQKDFHDEMRQKTNSNHNIGKKIDGSKEYQL